MLGDVLLCYQQDITCGLGHGLAHRLGFFFQSPETEQKREFSIHLSCLLFISALRAI